MMYYGTEMNALNFGIKTSQFRVSGIIYAGSITVQMEVYSTVELDFLVSV